MKVLMNSNRTSIRDVSNVFDSTKINNLDKAEQLTWDKDVVSGYYYKTTLYYPIALGVDFWMKAGLETGLEDDDAVEKPTDFSEAGYDMTQATATARALYKATGDFAKPAFRFDGSNDYYALNTYGGYNKVTICAVVSFQDVGRLSAILGGQGTGCWHLYRESTNEMSWFLYGPDTRVTTTVTMAQDTRYLITAIYDGADAVIRINGVQRATQAMTGNISTRQIDVGRAWDGSRTLKGDLADLMIFEELAIAGDELTTLESVLMTEYGIS